MVEAKNVDGVVGWTMGSIEDRSEALCWGGGMGKGGAQKKEIGLPSIQMLTRDRPFPNGRVKKKLIDRLQSKLKLIYFWPYLKE